MCVSCDSPGNILHPDLVVIMAILPLRPDLIDHSVVTPKERIRRARETTNMPPQEVVGVGVGSRFDVSSESISSAVSFQASDNFLDALQKTRFSR